MPMTPPCRVSKYSAEGALPLEHWWTTFDEPALNALVDEALANNLDLQAAVARIEVAVTAPLADRGP